MNKNKKGCQFWNDCDTCPFPDCYKDNPAQVKRFQNKQKALELQKQGVSVKDISNIIGKSKDAVRQYLKEGVNDALHTSRRPS